MQDDWEDLFVTGNEEIVAMKEDISHLVRDWTLVQNDYNEYLFDAMQDDWEGGHNEAWLDEQQVRMNNYKVQYAIKDDNLKKKIKGLRRQFRSDYCKKHPNKCVKPIPWAAAAAAATATSDEALTKQHQMGSCRKDSHSRLPAAPPP